VYSPVTQHFIDGYFYMVPSMGISVFRLGISVFRLGISVFLLGLQFSFWVYSFPSAIAVPSSTLGWIAEGWFPTLKQGVVLIPISGAYRATNRPFSMGYKMCISHYSTFYRWLFLHGSPSSSFHGYFSFPSGYFSFPSGYFSFPSGYFSFPSGYFSFPSGLF